MFVDVLKGRANLRNVERSLCEIDSSELEQTAGKFVSFLKTDLAVVAVDSVCLQSLLMSSCLWCLYLSDCYLLMAVYQSDYFVTVVAAAVEELSEQTVT